VKWLKQITYMTWWDLLGCFVLLLGASLLVLIGSLALVTGFGMAYVLMCFGAAGLLLYALCVMGWACIGMGKMYGWGIRFGKNKKGKRRA